MHLAAVIPVEQTFPYFKKMRVQIGQNHLINYSVESFIKQCDRCSREKKPVLNKFHVIKLNNNEDKTSKKNSEKSS